MLENSNLSYEKPELGQFTKKLVKLMKQVMVNNSNCNVPFTYTFSNVLTFTRGCELKTRGLKYSKYDLHGIILHLIYKNHPEFIFSHAANNWDFLEDNDIEIGLCTYRVDYTITISNYITVIKGGRRECQSISIYAKYLGGTELDII